MTQSFMGKKERINNVRRPAELPGIDDITTKCQCLYRSFDEFLEGKTLVMTIMKRIQTVLFLRIAAVSIL